MVNAFRKQSLQDKIFDIVNTGALCLFLAVLLYPLLFVASASISAPMAVIAGKVWIFPVDVSFDGYTAVFKHRLIMSGFMNSLFYTVFGTIVNVVLTIMAAYPLSRPDFTGRHVYMFLFVFTMMFTGGLIPTYLLVKDLGLLNSRFSLILPAALSVWNVIIARTYFQTTIPKEMLEASQLDGCSDIRFLTRIVIPLSGPIVAVVTLFYAVGHWNQFFNALIYLKDPKLYPLQLVLRDILVQNEVSRDMLTDVREAAARDALREQLKYALIVVASVPLLILYPFLQKYFVKGIMIGSLKG